MNFKFFNGRVSDSGERSDSTADASRPGYRHISLLVVAMAMHVHEFGGGGASEGVYLFGCLVEISTIFLRNDSTFK